MGKNKNNKQSKSFKGKSNNGNSGKSSNFAVGKSLNLQLASIGLIEKDIKGDGNCLFRSLADQFYGDSERHEELRKQVVDHMVQNCDLYKDFITDDESFEKYAKRMENDGVYGTNLELVAASRHLKRVILVHQESQPVWKIGGDDDIDLATGSNLHILYYSWEHYSSLRNRVDGSLPVKLQANPTQDPASVPLEQELSDFEKIIFHSIPSLVLERDLGRVQELLRKHLGNPSDVVDELLELEDALQETEKDPDYNIDKLKEENDEKGSEWIPEHIKQQESKQKSRKDKIQESRERRKSKKKVAIKSGKNGSDSDDSNGQLAVMLNAISI